MKLRTDNSQRHWGLNQFYWPNLRPWFCCCQATNNVYLAWRLPYLSHVPSQGNNQINKHSVIKLRTDTSQRSWGLNHFCWPNLRPGVCCFQTTNFVYLAWILHNLPTVSSQGSSHINKHSVMKLRTDSSQRSWGLNHIAWPNLHPGFCCFQTTKVVYFAWRPHNLPNVSSQGSNQINIVWWNLERTAADATGGLNQLYWSNLRPGFCCCQTTNVVKLAWRLLRLSNVPPQGNNQIIIRWWNKERGSQHTGSQI